MSHKLKSFLLSLLPSLGNATSLFLIAASTISGDANLSSNLSQIRASPSFGLCELEDLILIAHLLDSVPNYLINMSISSTGEKLSSLATSIKSDFHTL